MNWVIANIAREYDEIAAKINSEYQELSHKVNTELHELSSKGENLNRGIRRTFDDFVDPSSL